MKLKPWSCHTAVWCELDNHEVVVGRWDRKAPDENTNTPDAWFDFHSWHFKYDLKSADQTDLLFSCHISQDSGGIVQASLWLLQVKLSKVWLKWNLIH